MVFILTCVSLFPYILVLGLHYVPRYRRETICPLGLASPTRVVYLFAIKSLLPPLSDLHLFPQKPPSSISSVAVVERFVIPSTDIPANNLQMMQTVYVDTSTNIGVAKVQVYLDRISQCANECGQNHGGKGDTTVIYIVPVFPSDGVLGSGVFNKGLLRVNEIIVMSLPTR